MFYLKAKFDSRLQEPIAENLYIPATASEPEVDFRFDTHS